MMMAYNFKPASVSTPANTAQNNSHINNNRNPTAKIMSLPPSNGKLTPIHPSINGMFNVNPQLPQSPPPIGALTHNLFPTQGGSPTVANSQHHRPGANINIELDSIRNKNDLSRSFEDDLIYCPRSLLSTQELLACEQLDFMMFNNNNINQLSPDSSMGQPKFNPYTSQSFNPSGPETN
ncbi:hypothetical protein Kpol_1002p26 [Vanderwaltozyma polyspora DSM 70294]|uniref:Uncharacterized protein n=1 Tax=Vanderwaltozyma polyspora (strain ATCC 22028 / DSM 70294 / BCRC 21397 / CBS 2163 / NBRC 10782 / NRRL Y-8283 / UCD 57-17) TaxID=436907 RepID=A7TE58_VANPO|nr:uncharacterized protein Kpol_1002p26 [Vanderwaltozyma polyspora DSM 70294]EDO19380.1 hypothetical protein Kpol_1002p26 [Vanderwaltozyma polyspora DSM 70294]